MMPTIRSAAMILACGAACLVGCQRDRETATPDTSTAAADSPIAFGSAASATAGLPPPDTESSLTVKRAIATLTADARTFRLCRDAEELWLIDQSSAGLDEVYAHVTQGAAQQIYLEVRGERTAAAAGRGIPAEYTDVFVLEELLYAANVGAGTSCGGSPPAYQLRAAGHDPEWSLSLEGDGLAFVDAGGIPLRWPAPAATDAEGTVTYTSRREAVPLELLVASDGCKDDRTREYFAYSAEVRTGGAVFRGCARRIE